MEMLGINPMQSKLETCHDNIIRIRLVVGISYISRCKHGKVDNSWSLHMLKWKWLENIIILNLVKEKGSSKILKHIDLQSQATHVD